MISTYPPSLFYICHLQIITTGVSYTYGSDGTRLTKTVNGVKTSYTWDGAQLVSQKTTGGDTLYFTYHGDSRVAVEYKGNTYYYIYNLQGDVVGLVNSNGTSVVSYTYDAWGNPESTTGSMASTLGVDNPFRYRSYYFDTESGLYYLMSRYYDPVVGRFLNADGLISTGQGSLGYNMFAYCNNNPTIYKDSSGQLAFLAVLGIVAVAGFVISLSADNPKTVEAQKKQAENKYNYDLERARTNYNESNVSINNNMEPEQAIIQVTIAPDYEKNGKKDPVINIKDSYKVKTKAEKQAILEVVMASPEFDSTIFTRGMESWLSEWAGHNDLYSIASWTPLGKNLADVDLNEEEIIPWDWVW